MENSGQTSAEFNTLVLVMGAGGFFFVFFLRLYRICIGDDLGALDFQFSRIRALPTL